MEGIASIERKAGLTETRLKKAQRQEYEFQVMAYEWHFEVSDAMASIMSDCSGVWQTWHVSSRTYMVALGELCRELFYVTFPGSLSTLVTPASTGIHRTGRNGEMAFEHARIRSMVSG